MHLNNLVFYLKTPFNTPFNLPASIVRFQNVLYHASSPINYTVGTGLYMIPSNLNIGHIKDYNHTILIAQEGQPLGLSKINDEPSEQSEHSDQSGVIVEPKEPDRPKEPSDPEPKEPKSNHHKNMNTLSVLLVGGGLG